MTDFSKEIIALKKEIAHLKTILQIHEDKVLDLWKKTSSIFESLIEIKEELENEKCKNGASYEFCSKNTRNDGRRRKEAA